MLSPTKLIARCWSSPTSNIYYVDQKIYNNNLKLILAEGITADIEDSTITLNAEPYISELPTEPYLKSLNNVGPDSAGNVNVVGDGGCIAVGLSPASTLKAPTIAVRNDCSSCCSCEDYAYWMNRLNELIDNYNIAADKLRYLKDFYDRLVDFYECVVTTRICETVKVIGMPEQYQTTFNLSINNPTGLPICNVDALLSVISECTGARIVKMLVYYAEYDATDPLNITFKIARINAHSTWTGAVVIRWDTKGCQALAQFTANVPWNSSVVTTEVQMATEANNLPEPLFIESAIECCTMPLPDGWEPPVPPTTSITGITAISPFTSTTGTTAISPLTSTTGTTAGWPTADPTASPTADPTASPTADPTASPTADPTASPTADPTASPTADPTASPTADPTASPTAMITAGGPTAGGTPQFPITIGGGGGSGGWPGFPFGSGAPIEDPCVAHVFKCEDDQWSQIKVSSPTAWSGTTAQVSIELAGLCKFEVGPEGIEQIKELFDIDDNTEDEPEIRVRGAIRPTVTDEISINASDDDSVKYLVSGSGTYMSYHIISYDSDTGKGWMRVIGGLTLKYDDMPNNGALCGDLPCGSANTSIVFSDWMLESAISGIETIEVDMDPLIVDIERLGDCAFSARANLCCEAHGETLRQCRCYCNVDSINVKISDSEYATFGDIYYCTKCIDGICYLEVSVGRPDKQNTLKVEGYFPECVEACRDKLADPQSPYGRDTFESAWVGYNLLLKKINDGYDKTGYIKTTIPTMFYETPNEPIYSAANAYSAEYREYSYNSLGQLQEYNGYPGDHITSGIIYRYPFDTEHNSVVPATEFSFNVHIRLPNCLPTATEFISTFTLQLTSAFGGINYNCPECGQPTDSETARLRQLIEEIEFTISGRVNPRDVPERKDPCPQDASSS